MGFFDTINTPQTMANLALIAGQDPGQVMVQQAQTLQAQQEMAMREAEFQRQQAAQQAIAGLDTTDPQAVQRAYIQLSQVIGGASAAALLDGTIKSQQNKMAMEAYNQFNAPPQYTTEQIAQPAQAPIMQEPPQAPIQQQALPSQAQWMGMQMPDGQPTTPGNQINPDLGINPVVAMQPTAQAPQIAQPEQMPTLPNVMPETPYSGMPAGLQGLTKEQARLKAMQAATSPFPQIQEQGKILLEQMDRQDNIQRDNMRRLEERALAAQAKGVESKKTEFSQANTLRDELTQITKPSREVIDKYRQASSLIKNDNSASDVGLINLFARALSPGIVTDNDFQQAIKTGGLPQQVIAYWRTASGGGRLTSAQRAEILSSIKGLAAAEANNFMKIQSDYAERAKRYNLKPEDVIPRFGAEDVIKELKAETNIVPPELAAIGLTAADIAQYKQMRGLK